MKWNNVKGWEDNNKSIQVERNTNYTSQITSNLPAAHCENIHMKESHSISFQIWERETHLGWRKRIKDREKERIKGSKFQTGDHKGRECLSAEFKTIKLRVIIQHESPQWALKTGRFSIKKRAVEPLLQVRVQTSAHPSYLDNYCPIWKRPVFTNVLGN